MEKTQPQPIITVYGLSGTGKTRLVLSQPSLFDRPGVAIHGHSGQYGKMEKAQVFGYEQSTFASDPAAFREMLRNPAIRLLVIDQASQAEASFGHDFLLRIASSGKACLALAQSFDEACHLATFLNACKVNSALVPIDCRPLILGMCTNLLPDAEKEVW